MPRPLRLILVVMILSVTAFKGSCGSSRKSFEVLLGGPLAIQNQWTQVNPEQPFTAENDIQVVVLELEPPFVYDFYDEGEEPNAGKGILLPNKQVINPEIQIVDENGNSFDLVLAGARRTLWPAYGLAYPQEFPRDRKYKSVTFRAEQPINVKAVYWFCESSDDLK